MKKMNSDFNGQSCTSDSKHAQRMTDEKNGIEIGNMKQIGLKRITDKKNWNDVNPRTAGWSV